MDYEQVVMTLILEPSASRVCLDIPIFPDTLRENDEQFMVVIFRAPAEITVSPREATVTIRDIDSAYEMTIVPMQYYV